MEINNILSGNAFENSVQQNQGKPEFKASDAFLSLLNNINLKGADLQYSFNNILDNLTPVREKEPQLQEKNTDQTEKPKLNKKEKLETKTEKDPYFETQNISEDTKNINKTEVSYTVAPSENNSDYNTPTPNETDVGKPIPKTLQTPEAGLQKEGATVTSLKSEPQKTIDSQPNINTEKNTLLQNRSEITADNNKTNEILTANNTKEPVNIEKTVTPSPLLEQELNPKTNTQEKNIVLPKKVDDIPLQIQDTETQQSMFPERAIKVALNSKDTDLTNSGRMPESTPLNQEKTYLNLDAKNYETSKTEKASEQVIAKSILDSQKQQLASIANPNDTLKVEVKIKQNIEPSIQPKKTTLNAEDYSFETIEQEMDVELPIVKTDAKNAVKPINSTLNDGQIIKNPENQNMVKTSSLLNTGITTENQAITAQNVNAKNGTFKAELMNGTENQNAVKIKTNVTIQPNAIADKTNTLAKTVNAQKTANIPQHIRQNIIEQIKVNISKAADKEKGLDKIKINLKPKELGSIEVKMEVGNNGHLKTSITASRPETLDILQKDVRILERALADAGFDVKDNSLSFQLKGENQQSGQQQFTENHQQKILLSQEENSFKEEPELFGEDFIHSDENGLYAVNIKV